MTAHETRIDSIFNEAFRQHRPIAFRMANGTLIIAWVRGGHHGQFEVSLGRETITVWAGEIMDAEVIRVKI